MCKYYLSKKLFFVGLVLFIIGVIGVVLMMNKGNMIEKGELFIKQWDLLVENINFIVFFFECDVMFEWKESINGKNYIELKGNYFVNDKKVI